MAMTREEAAAYAASEFSELIAEAGLSDIENGGLKTPIDRTMRALSLPVAGPVPTEQEGPFLVILDWAVLARVERALANRVDVSVEGPTQSKRYAQAFAHVKALREEAWTRAEPFMAADAEPDDWEVASVSLGIVSQPLGGEW